MNGLLEKLERWAKAREQLAASRQVPRHTDLVMETENAAKDLHDHFRSDLCKQSTTMAGQHVDLSTYKLDDRIQAFIVLLVGQATMCWDQSGGVMELDHFKATAIGERLINIVETEVRTKITEDRDGCPF
jgi:hypothetical protein